MDIGQRIMELRKRRGMTQEQLAEILGTTRQAVSKWESGKSTPDLDYAIAMGKHFGVSMDYLLLGQDMLITVSSEAQTHKKNKAALFYVLLAIGIMLCLLLPLVADIYRNIIFQSKGVAYTNPNLYLFEWPLKGLTCIAVGTSLTGLGGIIWLWYRKNKYK